MNRIGKFVKVIMIIYICRFICENVLLPAKSSVIGLRTLFISGVHCLHRITCPW